MDNFIENNEKIFNLNNKNGVKNLEENFDLKSENGAENLEKNGENNLNKEEILYENYRDLKANLNEFYRNLVFVDDVFCQKKEEIEEELEKSIFENESSRLYKNSVEEIADLKQKIELCFEDFNFNSSFDVYKTFSNLLETWQADLVLINSFSTNDVFENNKVDEVFLFNLSFLEVLKIETNIIRDRIDNLIEKTHNLIKK